MKILFINVIFCIVISNCYSQNLVPNPSFEDTVKIYLSSHIIYFFAFSIYNKIIHKTNENYFIYLPAFIFNQSKIKVAESCSKSEF